MRPLVGRYVALGVAVVAVGGTATGLATRHAHDASHDTPSQPQGSTWETRPRPRDGVFEASSPYPSQFYDLEGRDWQHWQAGWFTFVEAGALTQDERQGIVIVRQMPYPLRVSLVPRQGALTAPDPTRTAVYRSPVKLGKLHIVAARRQVLTLVTRIGYRRLSFNVATRRFSLTKTG